MTDISSDVKVTGPAGAHLVGAAGVADFGLGLLGIAGSGGAAVRGGGKAGGVAGFFDDKVGVTRDLDVAGNLNVLGDGSGR